ncbi:1,4-dihydroxy-2-naphthoate octaprenyltransferase [Kordia sp. YSTF-M3]|uniref:1,4-dihydroxy-2-naphthoate octaprenyltransferase n=1 Tax=Kordia aestuariivivens TaxID=2759037 RepID=A0ABR7Q8B0_9FLAO|nr:1,4-dihydroxy-2-naphthoate octaprenyltransferase [Kordia aestuariivivens]MBC8754564.1 1,4-dihydroxy-2-naphthoate octaprenyltransferase [Kordia aestuariivivens]
MIKAWLAAARLRTLPLSISGIIVGCAMANFSVFDNEHPGLIQFYVGKTNYLIFILAILTTVGFQVLSNFANDYGDGIRGTDDDREGEQRMVASGIISPKQMKNAMIYTAIITLILALLVIYVAFGSENFNYSVLFFFLGITSIIAAVKYTVGKSAYGYSGLGDIFVFLFFGWLSVVGSFFLYTKNLNFDIFLPATAIGLLSAAVLNLNNMRDRIKDKSHGKNTLVVKIGSQYAKLYHYCLILGALACSLFYVYIRGKYSIQHYIFLIAFIPLVMNMVVVGKNIIHRELDPELKKVALSTFLYAILFAIFN